MKTCVFFFLDVLNFNLLNLIKYLKISNILFIENNNNLWTLNNNKVIFILKIALNIWNTTPAVFFVYFGEVISLGMIIHVIQHCINTTLFFLFGAVLTDIFLLWDRFNQQLGLFWPKLEPFGLRQFLIGAVLTGNHAYNTCSIFLPPILKALFSSLEHKVLRVRYCDWSLSVVHLPLVVPSTFLLKHLLNWKSYSNYAPGQLNTLNYVRTFWNDFFTWTANGNLIKLNKNKSLVSLIAFIFGL